MGMDVSGKNPTSEVGAYFRNTVWWWHPLWDYCVRVAPDVARCVTYGHSNDGDGLDAEHAAQLAAILTEELHSGRTAEYEREYMTRINELPDETCTICNGDGVRNDAIAKKLGLDGSACNRCHGKGTQRPWAASNPFSTDNVAEFRDFVAASGGFEIW